MKKILRFLAVAALMLAPAMAGAQGSVTVANGTATNAYVPVYGYYADAYLRSQSIYPASMLTDISTGSSILQMTFYADYSDDAYVNWGDVEFEVKLGEVTDTVLTAFSSASLTTVYTGSLNIDVNGQMSFDLDDAYSYGGGNLLVEIALTEPDDYEDAYFVGISRTGASWQGYSYASFDDITGFARDFLPKLTIAYGDAPSCFRVTDLAVTTFDAYSVTLGWNDTINGSGTTYNVYDMSDTTLLTSSTTTDATVYGLDPATSYLLGVTASCTDGSESFFALVNVRTDCENGSCDMTVYATDAYGDGWNGGYLSFVQSGSAVATYSMAGQGVWNETIYDTFQVSVCSGEPVTLHWTTGTFPEEVGFVIADGSGSPVFTCAAGDFAGVEDSTLATLADACSGCAMPSVYVTEVSSSSVTIEWHEVDGSMGYVVTDATGAATTIYDTTYTFDDLAANTLYTFGVANLCSATDSSNTATVSVSTLCVATAVPFVESFEATSATAGCWTLQYSSSANAVSVTTLDDGNAALRFSSYSTASDFNQYAFSPELEYDGDSSVLYYTVRFATETSNDMLYFGYTTQSSVNAADYTWTAMPYTSTDGEMEYYSAVVPADVKHVGIHYYGSYQYYAWVDSVTVSDQPIAIPAPDSVTMVYAVNDATMGSITPAPGTYRYGVGDALSLVATPATGYAVAGWEVTALDADDDTLYTFAIPFQEASFWDDVYDQDYVDNSMANQTIYVTAMFADESVASSIILEVSVNDPTMGTTIPAPGTYTLQAGDYMTVEAVPATGYYHVGWAIATSFLGMPYVDTIWYDNPEFEHEMVLDLTDTTDATWGITIALSAIFSADSTPEVPQGVFTLVCGVNNPTYGTTNPAPGTYTYHVGDTVSMVAVPNEGYYVTGWLYKLQMGGVTFMEDTIPYATTDILSFLSEDGVYVVDSSDVDLTITLIAILEQGEAGTVTLVTAVNDPSMGSITPAPGTHTYTVGQSVTFTMTPTEGHYLHSVHLTASHPMYGVVEDDTLVVGVDMDLDELSEPIMLEEGMAGFVISVTAIFAVDGQNPPEGIDDVDNDNVKVYSTEDRICVTGAEGRQVTLFDVSGRVLGSEARATERVEFRVNASGIYLVKVGKAAARCVAVVR